MIGSENDQTPMNVHIITGPAQHVPALPFYLRFEAISISSGTYSFMGRPARSISIGYILMEVCPGMALISLNTTRFVPASRKKSTLAIPKQSQAL